MQTDPARRRWLQALALATLLPARRAAVAMPAAAPLRMALGWDEPGASPNDERVHCIGIWSLAAGRAEVAARQVVPTRAHGIARLPSGELLAVARRPGLWLRRWAADGRLLHEAWAEPGRQFNGHVIAGADGRVVYSAEQTHDDGAGCVALRDPHTLRLLDEWPTGGTDPHQLLCVDGTLYVANGGVPTRPETGRARQALSTMDSSLVALDARSGRHLGAWRLPDARLSLRHLAWHPGLALLGIALQAEHDDPAQRARAPLLALFDGRDLRAVALPAPRAEAGGGYAGDIAATADGFVLSATRAGALMAWSARDGWATPRALDEAGALAAGPRGDALCALGAGLVWPGDGAPNQGVPPGCKPDNHALRLPG